MKFGEVNVFPRGASYGVGPLNPASAPSPSPGRGRVGMAEKGAVDGRDADVRTDVEDGSEHVLPDDRRGRAFLDNAALVQNHQALRVPGRLVQVVERHDHGKAVLTVQRPDEVERLYLVVVGSSRRRMRGSCARASAIQTRWRSPPERLSKRRCRKRPEDVSSSARSTAARSLSVSIRSGPVWGYLPCSTSSCTVIPGTAPGD